MDMSRCRCGNRARIVSNVVQSMQGGSDRCVDVCSNPICGEPGNLSLYAPLIYDEIGVNLCTTFATGVNIPEEYPTVTKATIQAIDASYEYGEDNVEIEGIRGRQNCVSVTLSNITVTFALRLYDDACRLVDTIYPTAVYLPSDEMAETFDEDTNPTSVELELFAPYGLAYEEGGENGFTPILNYVGFLDTNNSVTQGLNMYCIAKLIDLDLEESEITVGLTCVLQSLYHAGYKVESEGKIDTPKGSIINPEDSDCLRFVAGDLLNLEIRPLNLGAPDYEENLKQECCDPEENCSGSCGCGPNSQA